MKELRGITWTHERGFAPLKRLAELALLDGPLRVDAPPIVWEAQDLAGFESRSIAELAREYDLIVLDHPGLGRAWSAGALEPLQELSGLTPADLEGRFVTGSLASYHYRGAQWAIPIDAATQVSAWADCQPAATWAEVISRQDDRMALPTKSPHAMLTFLGIAAAVSPGFEMSAHELVPARTGENAMEIFGNMVRSMPSASLDMDPINILEKISDGQLDACPLLYGYVTYARPSSRKRIITFANAPGTHSGAPGCILGGTGLALSRHSANKEGALAHLRQISSETAQQEVFGAAGGQPADATVWGESSLDRESNGFYSATLRSQSGSMVRPRYDGWIDFHHDASTFLLTSARDNRRPPEVVARLNKLHREAIQSSSSPVL
ncbi:hypothetical protein EH165_10125 [Nakamurella antarctica]|uniref:Carbohydrate ABC transporter substrate-binding protein, CUT1 family n=1 Tax=Nakamurella antarctica TaxID=1902245 RepID=A0A3G8ZXS2_9ACTN|nr:hypothetical protein [Nakamurella antarctica]AZI58441.1 hypothetical protein EH165_10125 [Nakamurella antarctica]